jgi:hypothetical protein
VALAFDVAASHLLFIRENELEERRLDNLATVLFSGMARALTGDGSSSDESDYAAMAARAAEWEGFE